MSSKYPIFAYSNEKFNLEKIIKGTYKTFFNNFNYLSIFLSNEQKYDLKNIEEVEKAFEKLNLNNISSFSLSNDSFSFEFTLLTDSNLEVSFYYDSSSQEKKGKILKYIFEILILNNSDLSYLSNLNDDFEDHYEIQEEISNLINKNDYLKILNYIKERKHYFNIICFKEKDLNTDFLKEDFKIGIFKYLFLQNQKDKMI